ncbi:MAG TPA: glycosyltransferase family 39 protein [Gaiellaceae bacterium]|nr:glycosyltransferase family 39 protein [Gaiellaceae bacterium]
MTPARRRAAEAGAIAALLAAEGVLFARNLHTRPNYDEGVYLASLDALRHGETLGSEIFASQPPGFYLILRVIGLFSGHSLTDARIGFLLVALIGCAAAYALGRAIAGVMGGLAAAGLVAILSPFPSQAMLVDADVPAVSFSLVALALTAWSTRRRSVWLAALAGAAFAFAVSVKLDALIAVVPLAALLISARASRRLVLAIGAGAAVVTAAYIVAYAGVLGSLWESVVTFHRQARAFPSPVPNAHVVGHFLDFSTPSAWLVVLGLVAGVLAWRRTWPLWLWPIAAALFLLWQRPLFDHHLVLLCAALGAAAGTSIGRLPPVLVAAVVAAIAVGGLQQFHRIGLNVVGEPPELRWGVEQLRRCPEPVASDQPIVPFQARRRVPGQLVDTSLVRLATLSLPPEKVLRIIDQEHVQAVFASRGFEQPEILAGLAERFGPPRRTESARVYLGRACAD